MHVLICSRLWQKSKGTNLKIRLSCQTKFFLLSRTDCLKQKRSVSSENDFMGKLPKHFLYLKNRDKFWRCTGIHLMSRNNTIQRTSKGWSICFRIASIASKTVIWLETLLIQQIKLILFEKLHEMSQLMVSCKRLPFINEQKEIRAAHYNAVLHHTEKMVRWDKNRSRAYEDSFSANWCIHKWFHQSNDSRGHKDFGRD